MIIKQCNAPASCQILLQQVICSTLQRNICWREKSLVLGLCGDVGVGNFSTEFGLFLKFKYSIEVMSYFLFVSGHSKLPPSKVWPCLQKIHVYRRLQSAGAKDKVVLVLRICKNTVDLFALTKRLLKIYHFLLDCFDALSPQFFKDNGAGIRGRGTDCNLRVSVKLDFV